jgi:hypothetical protein
MYRCTSPNWEGKFGKVGEEISPSAVNGMAIIAIKSEHFNLKLKKKSLNKEHIDKKVLTMR